MTENVSFRRKIIYIVAIAVLLLPLALLGRPRTIREKGGMLAEERERIGLSQAQLGKIDPASESMKLATLGLRGVAANLMWQQAFEYKKKEQWDDLSSACEQIVRLEPNYVMVWEHQGHNLAYNVSAEFDDYRQRYNWVRKGIDFLIEGTQYNRDDPRLIWYVGWILGQKINRSDEKESFRKLYRDDRDFHESMRGQGVNIDATRGPDQKPDAWLASREWYKKGQYAVDTNGGGLKGKNPPVFHQSPTKSLMNFIEDWQKERNFDLDMARNTWKAAYDEWTGDFGARDLPGIEGFTYHLNDKEALLEKVKDEWAKLEAIVPGERVRRVAARVKQEKNVPPSALAVLDKPQAEWTSEEQQVYQQIEEYYPPNVEEIAASAPKIDTVKARNIARQINYFDARITRISRARAVINYEYWRDRCAAEATEDCARARRLLYEAGKLQEEASFEAAEKKYEEAFKKWNDVFRQYPSLMNDMNAEDVVLAVEKYIGVLEALERANKYNQVLPSNFSLKELLQRFERRALLAKIKQAEKEAINETAEKLEELRRAEQEKLGLPKANPDKPESPKPEEPKPEQPKEDPKPEEPKSDDTKPEESESAGSGNAKS